jgi:hypothetical protein
VARHRGGPPPFCTPTSLILYTLPCPLLLILLLIIIIITIIIIIAIAILLLILIILLPPFSTSPPPPGGTRKWVLFASFATPQNKREPDGTSLLVATIATTAIPPPTNNLKLPSQLGIYFYTNPKMLLILPNRHEKISEKLT